MSVGPHDILTVRKRDEHTKTPSWFTNTNVYSLLHFSEVFGKRETAYENWADYVSLTKRNKMSWGERGQTLTFNYLSCFYCRSNRACSLVSSSQLHVWCEPSFQSLPENRGRNFWRSSQGHVWCPTDCFSHVTSGHQLTPFPVFSPAPTAITAFSFEFSSVNQNSSSIRCWYVSILNPGIPNYFHSERIWMRSTLLKKSRGRAKLYSVGFTLPSLYSNLTMTT